MAEQLVTHTSTKLLPCVCDIGGVLPVNVVLCIQPELVAPIECPEDPAQTFNFSFIQAELIDWCVSQQNCQRRIYTYTFRYDDSQLASFDVGEGEADPILIPGNVLDAFCKECRELWIEEIVGDEPFVESNGPTFTFVSPHGCRYDFDTNFVLNANDTASIDLTLAGNDLTADLIASPDAGNKLQLLGNGVFVAELSILDTDTIDFGISTISQVQTLTGSVRLDVAGNNILTSSAAGLLAPEFTVSDTNSVDLTVAGTPQDLSADVIISPDPGNIISTLGNGLFAAATPGFTVADTTTIDLTLAAAVLSADAILSALGDNLVRDSGGLYVSALTRSVTNSTAITLTGAPAQDITVDVVISPDAGNIISILANGLFASSAPVIADTNSIDLTDTAGTITADLIIDPAGNNIITVSATGVLAPEVAVTDTNSIDLTIAGTPQDLSADIIVDPDGTNILTVSGAGVLVPATIPGDHIIRKDIPGSNIGGSNVNDWRVNNLGAGGTATTLWNIQVPEDWDTSQDPTIQAFGFSANSVDGDYRFEWGLTHRAATEMMTVAEDETIAFTQLPLAVDVLLFTDVQSLDRTLIAAGDLTRVRFTRLGADVLDTQSGNFRLVGFLVRFPRTGFGVTG